MTKISTLAIIGAVCAALGTAVYAQARHDEKPHGEGKPSAASGTSVADRAPGRHDERPHGTPKKKANKADAKKVNAKKGETSK